MTDEKKDLKHHHEQPPPPPPQYGTFQGVANHPPQPAYGFPQPIPPPGISGVPMPPSQPQYYPHGYQAVQGYVVAEGRPVRHRRLPCCGIGIGWFFFIIGFFLAGIPWYIAAFLLLCSTVDPREKPGYVASTIAAVLISFALLFGLTRIDD